MGVNWCLLLLMGIIVSPVCASLFGFGSDSTSDPLQWTDVYKYKVYQPRGYATSADIVYVVVKHDQFDNWKDVFIDANTYYHLSVRVGNGSL